MFPSNEKLYGDVDFIFQQDWSPAHSTKYISWMSSWYHCNLTDLSPQNVYGVLLVGRSNTLKNDLRTTVKAARTSADPQTGGLHATPQ